MASTLAHDRLKESRLSKEADRLAYEGLGTVNAYEALRIADFRGSSGWTSVAVPNICDTRTGVTVSLPANKRVRVVAAWDAHPQGPNDTNVPIRSNVNLAVLPATGTTPIASSNRLTSNVEWVDFSTTAAGSYRFRVFSVGRCAEEEVGLAWSVVD
jgi:hypothetical protein